METAPVDIQLKSLPEVAGVYQYFDKNGKMLYVGKAKNLKKRVGSYFTKTHANRRTAVLVKQIKHIEHIVVQTEMDALLLENSLIKEHQPRYNVMLKDDKTYPWICIKNEAFPRVFTTRKVIRDGSDYFGPYTSMKTVRTLLNLIKSLYPLRSCSYDLREDKIKAKKFKVCLDYHLGNCLGPCEAKLDQSVYDANIKAIRQIIKGDFKASLTAFENQMKRYAEALAFEKAQQIKEKINILKNYQAKSTVVNPKINNADVFALFSDESHAYINYLQIAHGAIVRSHTMELKKKLEETDKQLLRLAIVELQQRFKSSANEIYCSHDIHLDASFKILVPQQGDKKKLVDLSLQNAKFYRIEQFKQMKIVDPERHVKRIMSQMQADLRLSAPPYHIECFDNSNLQGSNPVAACVVFKNGKPSKKEYRHFNIKSVAGPNDFASMEEVVFRRYKRLLEEGASLPQLIVIDGGKGQLSSALKSLDLLGLRGKIAIIGIAKRLEEIFFPEDPIPLYIDKKSESLKIIQRARDEAHRFGIRFHRNKRSKGGLQSQMDKLPGVGPATRAQLLKEFKSLKRIKTASEEEITTLFGPSKGKKIYASLKLLDS
ncbi:MAG: excinuclease ABC subunit UvrC [Flavobacteriaceae bacterium]